MGRWRDGCRHPNVNFSHKILIISHHLLMPEESPAIPTATVDNEEGIAEEPYDLSGYSFAGARAKILRARAKILRARSALRWSSRATASLTVQLSPTEDQCSKMIGR